MYRQQWHVLEYSPDSVGVYPPDEIYGDTGGTIIKICGGLSVSTKLDIAHVIADGLNRLGPIEHIDNRIAEEEELPYDFPEPQSGALPWILTGIMIAAVVVFSILFTGWTYE